MTNEELDRIGAWYRDHWDEVCGYAREDITNLIAAVRELQAENERLKKSEQFANAMCYCELQANRGGY